MANGEQKKASNRLDKLMSQLIRERADWVCESCRKDFKNNHFYLDWSHYISRGEFHVRWHPNNGNAHCKQCHHEFGRCPGKHASWYRQHMGEGSERILHDYLENRRKKMSKWSLADKLDMIEHYKEQLKIMKKKRDEGVTGFLDFVSYD